MRDRDLAILFSRLLIIYMINIRVFICPNRSRTVYPLVTASEPRQTFSQKKNYKDTIEFFLVSNTASPLTNLSIIFF